MLNAQDIANARVNDMPRVYVTSRLCFQRFLEGTPAAYANFNDSSSGTVLEACALKRCTVVKPFVVQLAGMARRRSMASLRLTLAADPHDSGLLVRNLS